MSAILSSKWKEVGKLYESGLSMREVAGKFGVTIDAVVYVLRKLEIPRRSAVEANKIVFQKRPLSFTIRTKHTSKQITLEALGAMLYWAEGYKTKSASGIDFANSDVAMVTLFMNFLRSRYVLDEKRLRPMIYCYSNQEPDALRKFWSDTLRIPVTQFTKPYVRTDYRKHGRIMPYGLLHIRYSDKKLLHDVLSLIESYKAQYASVG